MDYDTDGSGLIEYEASALQWLLHIFIISAIITIIITSIILYCYQYVQCIMQLLHYSNIVVTHIIVYYYYYHYYYYQQQQQQQQCYSYYYIIIIMLVISVISTIIILVVIIYKASALLSQRCFFRGRFAVTRRGGNPRSNKHYFQWFSMLQSQSSCLLPAQ